MASVFKKLISKEFGETKYNKYFYSYQKKIADRTYNHRELENPEIFDDIYNTLKDVSLDKLLEKQKRLSETMISALRISKTYLFAFIFFVIASVFIIIMKLVPLIAVFSVILMTGCFLYKTYEFLVNKFCFIDAHIILVYKSVLDKLLDLNI